MECRGSSGDDRDTSHRAHSHHGSGRRLHRGERTCGISIPPEPTGAYQFVARTLARLGYYALDRPSKTLVKRFLAKTTGYSRAQLTRLIRQHRKTGRVADRRDGNQGQPFERVYSTADVRLLARVDAGRAAPQVPCLRRCALRAPCGNLGEPHLQPAPSCPRPAWPRRKRRALRKGARRNDPFRREQGAPRQHFGLPIPSASVRPRHR